MNSSLWQLGFRPFFLLGALDSILVLFLWLGFLAGWIPGFGHLDPALWHSHEMLYGFATAIIAGFVLTASQNWTGIRGLNGRPLQLLVALWVLGRLFLLFSWVPGVLAAVVDLSFYPMLAIFMIRYLKVPGLRAERIFFVIFALFFGGNLLVHLDALGLLAGTARTGIQLALNTVILVIIFMGGRVIPFFTASELSRKQPRTWPSVEVASMASMVVYLLCDLFWPGSLAFAAVAILTAVIHLIRLWGWQVRRLRRIPLVWVLHIAYLWLVLGFLLSGLSTLGLLARSLAVHAFTVGGIGMIILGMISRVSLGHTGRRLHPSAAIVGAYHLLNLAAISRVFGPLIVPTQYMTTLLITGLFWFGAFGIFLAVYSPMLLSPRVDGRAG